MTKPKFAKGEKPDHLRAFTIWYANDCDFHKASQIIAPKMKVSERTLYDWAERFDWWGRAAIINERVRQKAAERAATEKANMFVRHANYGRGLQMKGVDCFNKHRREIKEPEVAIRAIRAGIAIEREAELSAIGAGLGSGAGGPSGAAVLLYIPQNGRDDRTEED